MAHADRPDHGAVRAGQDLTGRQEGTAGSSADLRYEAPLRIFSASVKSKPVLCSDAPGPVWRPQHMVRVLAIRSSPAFSLVSGFRLVRRCAWKRRAVRPCCRRRCRQTAARVRAVEWALAGVLPGLGSGMARGPYAGPATRAGCAPARNVNEWPPGLARRGPRLGEVGKAHGADRPHRRACAPADSLPLPRRRPGARRSGASGLHSLLVARYALLRGLVADRPAVAEPRAGRVGGRAARDPRQRVALKT